MAPFVGGIRRLRDDLQSVVGPAVNQMTSDFAAFDEQIVAAMMGGIVHLRQDGAVATALLRLDPDADRKRSRAVDAARVAEIDMAVAVEIEYLADRADPTRRALDRPDDSFLGIAYVAALALIQRQVKREPGDLDLRALDRKSVV